MNTVLNVFDLDVIYENWKKEKERPRNLDSLMEKISTKQDTHTRLELAKAVREIENPLIGVEGSWAKCYQDGFEAMRKAVLKVIEGK